MYGAVQLVYFKGDPSEGDLVYARPRGGVTFPDPIRMNSEFPEQGQPGVDPHLQNFLRKRSGAHGL